MRGLTPTVRLHAARKAIGYYVGNKLQKPKESWQLEGSLFTAIYSMLVVLLVSGFGGAFFYYAMLRGIQMGTLSKGPMLWSRCVAACALMFAACASVIVQYFFDDVSYLLILALWPVFILALEPAYHLAGRGVGKEKLEAKQE